ncbi:MAG: MmgE/PrpD family protein [Chloroflexi bacterium]|nr:MmgE/PrpD family protein [Chloroflexota bacterium]
MDKLQERLANYAYSLNYESLSSDAVHAAKVRVIDTLGSLIGGFFAEPCRIARAMAAQVSSPMSATVLGTREKSSVEMAAFANATAARYVEMNDVYHWPGSDGGHPSDVITPILAIAEPAHSSGRDFLTAVVLAYEIYLRLADSVKLAERGFDYTNYVCLGTGVASGKLLGLSQAQLAQCVSLSVVPNNSLSQARRGHLSMWKAMASGQAGKAGVFAALLARQGIEGPVSPFCGDYGWFMAVSGKTLSLDVMGGNGTPFKIPDTIIKPRACCSNTISAALASEKVYPELKSARDIEHVKVEVWERAFRGSGSGEHHWHPQTRETADHSIPYVVAVALMDGSVGPRQFSPDRIADQELLALVQKVEVINNPEFTQAYMKIPAEHRIRVEVVTNDGKRHVSELSSIKGDPIDPMTDGEIEDKFRMQCEDFLGKDRVRFILDKLWQLEKMNDVAAIPPTFVL